MLHGSQRDSACALRTAVLYRAVAAGTPLLHQLQHAAACDHCHWYAPRSVCTMYNKQTQEQRNTDCARMRMG